MTSSIKKLTFDMYKSEEDAFYVSSSPATVNSSGGVPVTTTAEPVSLEDEELGGKPNPGTPADKRLRRNKDKGKSTPNSEGETEDLATDETATEPDDVPPVMQQTPQWRGILVQEGIETGDAREFAPDSVTWGAPPLPLRWQKVDSHGGMPTNETVQVGTIQRVWRDGSNIMGEGVFDLGGPEDDDAHEAFRRNQDGSLSGISIDADDISDADIEYIYGDAEDEEDGDDDIFLLLFGAPEKIVFHAGRIRAATLCDIPAFIDARIEPFTPDDAAAEVASIANQDPSPPFHGGPVGDSLIAHAWHDDWRPPRAWFENPKLGQVMPIIVTEQGRVYGHAAQWTQCHLGYKKECVSPPHEDYHDHFMTGHVICDDGALAAVGQITAGLEHAPLSLGASAAKQHYENTDAVVADVTVGNDQHGIWVAGAVRPGAMTARVTALRASGQVSPDWRSIGGKLRMVGLLTVNVSGYQVARARTLVAGGEMRTLVASGLVSVHPPTPEQVTDEELTRRALTALRAQLFAKVHTVKE